MLLVVLRAAMCGCGWPNNKVTIGLFPGNVSISFGGVARNIAECMARLGAHPLFVSVRGNDVVWYNRSLLLCQWGRDDTEWVSSLRQ